DTVRPARPVGIEALPLQVLHDRSDVEVLDRDAEMVQARRLVLEERQEVFPEAKEAVRLRFMDHGRTQVLLVEVSGALHIGYPYRDVVKSDTLEGRPEGRHGVRRGGDSREALD